MARYINADLIKQKLQRTIINSQTAFINNVLIGLLDKAPTEDVQEVKHGKWEKYDEDIFKCSECGYDWYLKNLASHPHDNDAFNCPLCGAKMDGDVK